MHYLLDTNVVLSAFRSRLGASHALLRRALGGEIRLVMHYKLASEYRDVLSRYLPIEEGGITFSEAERVLARLVADSNEIDVRYLWRPNLRDEGDRIRRFVSQSGEDVKRALAAGLSDQRRELSPER